MPRGNSFARNASALAIRQYTRGGDRTRVCYRGGALFVAAREVAQANAMAFLSSVADRTPGKVPCSVPPSRLRSSATANCSEWEPAQRHRTRKVSNFGHRFLGTSSWSGPVDRSKQGAKSNPFIDTPANNHMHLNGRTPNACAIATRAVLRRKSPWSHMHSSNKFVVALTGSSLLQH